MSLEAQVLGKPGSDNSVFIKLDTGQQIFRFLLDTGANCLWQLPRSELASVDHILFSHFHMDHISGFDNIFRLIYSKPTPVHIWGPKDTFKVIQSRAKGYSWNLVDKSRCKMFLHEIHENKIINAEIYLSEGFETLHIIGESEWSNSLIHEEKDFFINGAIMDHKIECMSYGIREKEKENVNPDALKELNLKPGKWCKDLKQLDAGTIEINGEFFDVLELKKKLTTKKSGQNIGYITDTIYNDQMQEKLIKFLKNADEVIMECAYLEEELELATKHHHMTVTQVSEFAKKTEIGKLTLFHISDRYPPETRTQFLKIARETFPETYYPPHWKITL